MHLEGEREMTIFTLIEEEEREGELKMNVLGKARSGREVYKEAMEKRERGSEDCYFISVL